MLLALTNFYKNLEKNVLRGANAEIARLFLIGPSGAPPSLEPDIDRVFPAAKDRCPEKSDPNDREAAPGDIREATAAAGRKTAASQVKE